MGNDFIYRRSVRWILRIGLWFLLSMALSWLFFKQYVADSLSKISGKMVSRYSIVNPHFFSLDQRGRPFFIKAKETIQEDQSRYRLINPQAQMARENHLPYTASSGIGYYEKKDQILELRNNVRLEHQGYIIDTEKANVDLKQKISSGKDQLQGVGPLGEFTGTGFALSKERLVINGPVEVILDAKLFQNQSPVLEKNE